MKDVVVYRINGGMEPALFRQQLPTDLLCKCMRQ
jgi:hypothetical protein